MNSSKKTRKLVLAAVFMALIAVMTVVPYTGYINYGLIEITTLHLIVILGSVTLGWKYGTLLGTFWGFTCMLRAFTNPAFILFTNPMISVVPRIFVGMVPGLVFEALKNGNRKIAVAIAAAAGTFTNTVLVLSALYIFGGMMSSFAVMYELFKTIITTVITLNGGLEMAAAVVLVPLIYTALQKSGSIPTGPELNPAQS